MAPGIETKRIACNFVGDIDIYDKIEAEWDGLDIAILGTNAV
jgi:hypothetical protein